jgi:PIN domain nuclease of toxin-antitoxin system
MQTSDRKDPIVLDTHVWIWLMTGAKELENSRCLSFIDRAVPYSGIKVSAISLWEAGMLEAKGRITLRIECLEWVRKALEAPGISLAPITPEIAIESSHLPGRFHGDPADRIIVSTARILGAALVTRDKNIISYGKEKHLRIIEA